MEETHTSEKDKRRVSHKGASSKTQKIGKPQKKRCAVCGEWFIPRHKNQKYCGAPCRRYANRHGGKTYDGTVFISDPGKEALREFDCRQCGQHVRVTEEGDLRTKFCSQRCENLYWKHSRRKKPALVERVFQCKGCGTIVHVTNPTDRRTVYCSRSCCIQYLSRHGSKTRKHQTNETSDERQS